MKVAVIGASEEAIYAIEQAKEQGLYVVGIDGSSEAEGLKYVNQAYTMDIKDEKRVIEKLQEDGVDGILPVPIGRYLTTVGAVNEALNLPGITKIVAERCTDKWYFHQILKSKGLRNIKSICGNQKYLHDKTENIDFPSILKPRFGSGSRDIHLIESRKELEDQLTKIDEKEEYIIEDFICGIEYGVDGAIVDGKFHLVLLREKLLTPLPYCQAIAYMSVTEYHLQQQVIEFLEQVIQTVGLQQSLFHADLMLTKSGEWFVIELSGRPSGHRLSSKFTRLCTGCDMISEYIKVLQGKVAVFETQHKKNYAIAYFDFSHAIIEEIPSKEELCLKGIPLVEYCCHIRQGEYMEDAKDGGIMKRGYFIVEGKNNEELHRYIKNVKEAFGIREELVSGER